jgi:transcriptional regulator
MSYPLRPFQVSDWPRLARVLRTYPLATLISQAEGWPLVTQVPLILDEGRGFLYGHFDRNNPQGPYLLEHPEVLALFQGPNHYISPTIYPTEQYPGWNYFTAHLKTRAAPREREQVRESLFRLAELHEPAGSGYTLSPTQRNFELYLDQIFGFELEILEARGVFKLAQDKGPENAKLAAAHLAKATGDPRLPELLAAIL